MEGQQFTNFYTVLWQIFGHRAFDYSEKLHARIVVGANDKFLEKLYHQTGESTEGAWNAT